MEYSHKGIAFRKFSDFSLFYQVQQSLSPKNIRQFGMVASFASHPAEVCYTPNGLSVLDINGYATKSPRVVRSVRALVLGKLENDDLPIPSSDLVPFYSHSVRANVCGIVATAPLSVSWTEKFDSLLASFEVPQLEPHFYFVGVPKRLANKLITIDPR